MDEVEKWQKEERAAGLRKHKWDDAAWDIFNKRANADNRSRLSGFYLFVYTIFVGQIEPLKAPGLSSRATPATPDRCRYRRSLYFEEV